SGRRSSRTRSTTSSTCEGSAPSSNRPCEAAASAPLWSPSSLLRDLNDRRRSSGSGGPAMLEILRPGAPGREDDFALGFGGDRRGRLRDLRLQLADVEPAGEKGSIPVALQEFKR